MTNTTSSTSKIQGKFAKSGRRKMEKTKKKQNELRGNKQKGKNKQIKWEKNRMDE
jgi:hypothetical protein